MTASATVFIVDDDPSVRKALQRLFTAVGIQVEVFAGAAELLLRAPAGEHGCVLLDIKMPKVTGIQLQGKLAGVGIDMPVIFLSAYADVPVAVRAMKEGALDVITKPFQEKALLDAVRRAIEVDATRRREGEEYQQLLRRFESLTAREQTVMALVVAGKRNREVAQLIGTSVKTVKVHRAHAMEKMEADSLPDLVRMADRLKLGIPAAEPGTVAGVPKGQ